MNWIKERFPGWHAIMPVFGTICFFSFSWSLYRFFWYLPSWLEYLSIWKVLVIATYVLAFALFESIGITFLLVAILALFPRRLFENRFISVAGSMAGLISLAAFLVQRKIGLVYRLEAGQIFAYLFVFLLLIAGAIQLTSWVFLRLPRLSDLVGILIERMTIFAYIYVPLGLIGWLVVLVRNLF